MDFDLSEEQRAIQDTARAFARDEMMPFAREWDEEEFFPVETLRRAAAHKGSAFVEIYQNCKIFNDGVFEYATDKSVKADNALYMEHGKPLLFGKDRNKGIRLNGINPEVVEIGKDCAIDDLLIHDEKADQPTLSYLLSRMVHPQFPECVGVYRAVRKPTYEEQLDGQIDAVTKARGKGDLDKLFRSDDLWVVD